MNRHYFLDAFDFYDCLIICNHIHSITTIKLNTLILQWERFLPLKRNLLQPQFMTITLLICRFQQTRPQMPMDLNRTCDYLFSQFLMIKHFFSVSP